MKHLVLLVVCMLVVACTVVSAAPVNLAERTTVKVALLETLVSGQGKPNDEVNFELREDIYGPNRELLATKGTPAYGHIIRTKKRGMFGRSGKLEFSCDYTKAVDGTKIPLRGSEVRSGKGNGGAMLATAALLTVVGVFINGRDVTINKGTELTAYVDQDTMIDPANNAAVLTATTPAANTYTISLSTKVCQDLAQQIASKVPSGDGITIAVSAFELRAEKESMRLDLAVGKNAREDLATALSTHSGFKVVDNRQWDLATAELKLEADNPLNATTAKQIGSAIKAQYIATGSISDRGAIVVVSVRVIDCQTGDSLCTVTTETPKS
ncbi:CsgG/HfaB family protein [bacterium]|nr:CsgG/HfaB family protein [bacterium]